MSCVRVCIAWQCGAAESFNGELVTTTARKHFDEDLDRVESLLGLANGDATIVRFGQRRNDLRLSSVAMAVGAMDAYFCDAYVDCLTLALRHHSIGSAPLPEAYAKQLLPAGEILNNTRPNRPYWSLRMAARSVMEKENILHMTQVKKMFNPVLPTGQKLWPSVMEPLIMNDWKRLTGISKSEYLALPGSSRKGARTASVKAVRTRIASTIQLRHDWIHNCGRPKVAILQMTRDQAVARIREVRALVTALDTHLIRHRSV